MAIGDILLRQSREMLGTRRLFNVNMDTTAATTSAGIGNSANIVASNINDNQNVLENLWKNNTNFELILPTTSSVSGVGASINNNNNSHHNNINSILFPPNFNITTNFNIGNLNLTYEETIHSGHFMLSQVHDDATTDDFDDENTVKEEKDAQSSSTGLNFRSSSTSHENVGASNLDFMDYNAAPSAIFSIDGSLTKLFECMTLAYRDCSYTTDGFCSGKIVSPKWKPFKGMRLRGKEIVRLNNIIWREWFMQYIQNKKPVVCQFANPLPDDSHKRTEAVVMEGKYWKRRLESVTGEYKSWRKFSKNQITRARRNSTTSKGSSQNNLYEWSFQGHNTTESNDAPYKIEDMEFSDALFSLSQPFPFPNPRELMQTGYSDLIQPVLMQLQPNLEDFMDTMEPMQLFSEMFNKSQHMPTSTVTSYQSEPNLLLSMESDLTSDLSSQVSPLTQSVVSPVPDPLKEKDCSLGIPQSKSASTLSPATQTDLYSTIAPVQLHQQHQPLSTINLLPNSQFCSPHSEGHVGGESQAASLLTDTSVPVQPPEVTSQVTKQMYNKMLQNYTVLPKVDTTAPVDPIVHQPLHHQYLSSGTTVVAPSYKGNAANATCTVNKDSTEVHAILAALINDSVNSSQTSLAPPLQAMTGSPCAPLTLSIPRHHKDNIVANPLVDAAGMLEMQHHPPAPAVAPSGSRVHRTIDLHCPQMTGNSYALLSSGATSSNNPDGLSMVLPRIEPGIGCSSSSTDNPVRVSTSTTTTPAAVVVVTSSATADLHHSSASSSSVAINRRHSYSNSSPSSSSLLPTTNSNNNSSIINSGNYLNNNKNNTNNNSKNSRSSSSSGSFNRSQGFIVPSNTQVARNKHRSTPQSASTVETVSEIPSSSFTTSHTFLAQLLTTGKYHSSPTDVKQEPLVKSCVNTPANLTSTTSTTTTTNFAPIRPAREPTSSTLHTPISLPSAIPTSIPINLTNVPSGSKVASTASNFSNSVLAATRNQPFHQDTTALTTTKQGNQSLQNEINSKPENPILCLGSSLPQGQDMDVSSFSTQSKVSCLKPKQNRIHPNEQRRVSHISAEQKRRGNIKNGFDVLHSLIPSLNQTPTGKVSKATMLQKAAEFCKKMKSERVKMQNESEILRLEIDSLNSDISYCQSQLPATGAPVSRQRADQINEMYDEYIRLRTNQNWKFWIFSMITRPLFTTYNNIVSTASMDEMCRTVMNWFDQYCSLAALRPMVSNALRQVSTSTSILTEPERLPEQAAAAVGLQSSHGR